MEYPLDVLAAEVDRLEAALRAQQEQTSREQLVDRVRQVRTAILLLEKCATFHIGSSARFTKLPAQICATPSSEYRVLEDVETDNRSAWVEVRQADGRQLRLHQGDVVVELD